MRIRLNHWPAGRVIATALAFAGTALWLQADAIIFTRPAVAIVAPAREDDSLPKSRGEQINFSTLQPASAAPAVQVIQQRPPRTRETDEDEDVHWLLRDPKKLPGMFGRDALKDPLKPKASFAEKDPLRQLWKEPGPNKKEEARS